jgi:hypothetical protein
MAQVWESNEFVVVAVVSTCLESLLQLATRVDLLVLLWLSRIILSKVKVLGGDFVPMDG